MPGNDLTGRASLDNTDMIRGLKGIRSEADRTARSLKKTGQEVSRWDSKRVANLDKEAAKAAKSTKGVSEQAKRGAEALSRMQGAAGGLAGNLAGAFGLSGALGRVAVAAAGAAAVMTILTAASDRNARKAMDAARANQQLAQSVKSLNDAADQEAAGVAQNAQAERRVLAAGSAVVGQRDRIAASGATDRQGANRAALALQGLDYQTQQAIIDSAERLQSVGRGNFVDLVETAARSRALTSAAGGVVTGDVDSVTFDRRLIRASSGERVSDAQYLTELRNIAPLRGGRLTTVGRFNRAVEDVNAINNETEAALVERFTGGAGARVAADRQQRILNPDQVAFREASEAILRELEVLRSGSEAEWTLVRILRDIGQVFGGEGSFQTQLNLRQQTLGQLGNGQ